MKWKITTGLLAALLVGSNLWHMFSVVDVDVSVMYHRQVVYEFANRLKAASHVCSLAVAGKSESETVDFLETQFPDEDPFVKEQGVHITWLSIQFDKNGNAQGCALDESVNTWASPQNE